MSVFFRLRRTAIMAVNANTEVITGVVTSYTAKYTQISSGYMGQLVEWPEVITEGNTIEECREMLRDALREMILAYKQIENLHQSNRLLPKLEDNL